MWEGTQASPVPLFIHFRPRLPKSQARPRDSHAPRAAAGGGSVLRAGVEAAQDSTAHPHRVRSGQARALQLTSPPTPAGTVARAPCGHWVRSQTGQPQACGQGRLSAPQEGTFPLQGRPRPATPTTMLVLGSKSHDDTPAPPPAQRHPPQPRPHPDCPLLYSTLGPRQRGYLHGRKV